MDCYKEMTSELVVVALIYIERLLTAAAEQAGDSAVLTDQNGKGVLHIALSMAAKFHLDCYEKDTIFFAVVESLTKKKMRKMTDAFINMIGFGFYVSDSEFKEAMSTIKHMIGQKFLQLGQIVILERNLRTKAVP
jgi:phosphoribosylaminoimidazole (AIR) synthetase